MTGFVRALLVVAGFLLAIVVVSISYINRISEIERRVQVIINDQVIIADVVSSRDDIERGLSGRDALGINEGMLFVFQEKEITPFWMKGMEFSIDIIWIADERIVGVTERVSPEPGTPTRELALYYPPEAVSKVLEISAGRAKLLRAGVGDSVVVKPIIPSLNF